MDAPRPIGWFMRTEERWDQIVQFVDHHGFLTIHELSELCATSAITIRRDLTQLHASGRVRRTHGGVASLHPRPLITPPEVDGDENHDADPPDRYPLDRLDVLITADML